MDEETLRRLAIWRFEQGDPPHEIWKRLGRSRRSAAASFVLPLVYGAILGGCTSRDLADAGSTERRALCANAQPTRH